ncbi:MAG: hypothetical protein COA62_02930 [Rhodobiaceae bacterium]|nr:MAG: hypothetical protein COA62_02930 [Rhodobiaceae bacterium]
MHQPLPAETAQTIALQALAYIASDEDKMAGFLAQTGLSTNELKDHLTEPAFLGGVLDFLLSDEKALVAFCEEAGIAPDLPKQARQSLPGGEEVHWT